MALRALGQPHIRKVRQVQRLLLGLTPNGRFLVLDFQGIESLTPRIAFALMYEHTSTMQVVGINMVPRVARVLSDFLSDPNDQIAFFDPGKYGDDEIPY